MKLKYVLYMAAALSLTGCNDSFLERGPQNLNDQSFWVSVDDLKAYANAQGIEIIGDLPIYVAEDSVDVWSCPQEFQLDENLVPTEVAGCPPDGFSATGQLWGNPLFDWVLFIIAPR